MVGHVGGAEEHEADLGPGIGGPVPALGHPGAQACIGDGADLVAALKRLHR